MGVGIVLLKPVVGALLAAYLFVSGTVGYYWNQQSIYHEEIAESGYVVHHPTGWIEGIVTNEFGRFDYEGKVYDNPSQYGINNGRVSKLTIRDKATGKTIVHYDRGWDIEPESLEHETVMEDILEKLTRNEGEKGK